MKIKKKILKIPKSNIFSHWKVLKKRTYNNIIKNNINNNAATLSAYKGNDFIETIKHCIFNRGIILNYTNNFVYDYRSESIQHPSNIICRAYEILYHQYGVKNIKFSRWFLDDRRREGYFDDGMRSVLEYVKTNGVPEKQYYTKNRKDKAYPNMLLNAYKHKITSYVRIYGVGDNEDSELLPKRDDTVLACVKDCIMRQIPVICLTTICDNICNLYNYKNSKPLYKGTKSSNEVGKLCGGVIVGYDDDNQTIIMDLGWGNWFGDNGCFRITYEDFLNDTKELWYFKNTEMLDEIALTPISHQYHFKLFIYTSIISFIVTIVLILLVVLFF